MRTPALQRLLATSLACLGLPAGCDFAPGFEGYLPCAAGCPAACVCLAEEICVPVDTSLSPACCLDGSCGEPPPSCEAGTVCPIGCACQGRVCVPPDSDPNVAYCNDELQDLSCLGPTWTVHDATELRDVLTMFSGTIGPHGVIFDPALGGELQLTEDLPAVTSLTFIDGGDAGFTLRGDGAVRGLTVAGTGVILSNLRLVGFPGHGVLIEGNSADVHLYGLRLGEPGAPNGVGLGIEPGARGVTLGRGRELECGAWMQWPMEDPPSAVPDWDVNVITANSGHGIEASGVHDLWIEGTWIGFDTLGDLGQGNWQLGNGGVGIRLENVLGASVGPRHLRPGEAGGDQDFRPGCVAVGRNAQGGVSIQGGGDIALECTQIGDTPVMTPWDENRGFGLRVEGNSAPVSYGPPAGAAGFGASSLNLIHTDGAPALVVRNARAGVWVRGAQLQRVYPQEAPPPFGIEIAGGDSQVELVQLSLLGAFGQGWIQVGPGAGLRLENCLVADFDPPKATPALVSGTTAELLELSSNLIINFAALCEGVCPPDAAGNRVMPLAEVSCAFHGNSLIPVSPDCPMVDCGLELGLDVNGVADGTSTGCGPDIGAFECTSPACEAAQGCPRPDCQ
ncbi:MAG TPA: hypothetical protein PK668_27905 [Myxococcota bacterium]|nr:hypothetical protein [Myxococcota bacterium]HRY97324.1 hypothetical protein [Myxococcota bacterium]HSA22456.1 hypothetical protein [Myxococcota bacterium]